MLTGLLSTSASRADVEVAPPPREVRADGSRDPAPVASQENPAEVVERIIKNSKAVGDKLAQTDTGPSTRSTQGKILKDIDALINRQKNPPPSGGGGNSQNKNDQKNSDSNKDQKNDMNPMGGNQPMGNNQQANSGRKPRMGEKGGQPKGGGPPPPPAGGKQDPGMGMAKSNPMPGKNPATPTKPKDPMAGAVAGAASGKKEPAKSSLPITDDVVKEVWGHLPDKLRQQVTQYYQEQFMPRYSDLLKQYYSSLANAPRKPDEMRK
jgi:hypothetical protein